MGDSSLSEIWEFIHRTIGKVKILQRGWGNLALLPEKISAEVPLKRAASSKTPLALAHGSYAGEKPLRAAAVKASPGLDATTPVGFSPPSVPEGFQRASGKLFCAPAGAYRLPTGEA